MLSVEESSLQSPQTHLGLASAFLKTLDDRWPL